MRTLLILLMVVCASFGSCIRYTLKPESVRYNGFAYSATYFSGQRELGFTFQDFPPSIFYWSSDYGTQCDYMTGRPKYH